MRSFIVCIHDATPAFARETQAMIRDLAPLVGPRLSAGVVPDWHGEWPLTAHDDYCQLLRESAEEVLLHGCFHRQRRGRGPVSWLAEGSDEMNGLDSGETWRTLEHGQQILTETFGQPARGFLAPAWQRGHVRLTSGNVPALEHILGFFSLDARDGRRVPLATSTWDCGRWSWLGHVGHALGRALHSSGDRVPVLAVHPRDLSRGFWQAIVKLTGELLDAGYEPATPSALLERRNVEVAV